MTTDDAKALSRSQFAANAENYADSHVHAKGASLDRVVTLVDPQSSWSMLDVATGAGHLAFALAPHVERVVASDLTEQMLAVTARLAEERGLANVSTHLADAEALPFDDASFDLVTSRIAPHHFPNPQAFVDEAFRVLRPQGVFVVVDNVVPDDEAVATFANDWERRRDPSHVRALPLAEWVERSERAGFDIVVAETADKNMNFTTWADNMSVPADVRDTLWQDLLTASDDVRAFLRPGDNSFVLTEGIVIARK